MSVALATLDDVRTRIKTFRPQVKKFRSISDLKIPNPYSLEINNKPYPITSDAMRGLCDELDMPPRFFASLHLKKKDAWDRLVKALQDQQKPVAVLATEREIIAVVSDIGEITKHSEVVETAALVLKDKSFQLRMVEFSGIELKIHIMHKTNIDMGRWMKDDDMFRQGVVLNNNIVKGFECQSSIERMVCTNLAYMTIPNTERRVKDLEKVPDFVFQRSFNDIADWLTRRVTKLRKANMSLHELFNTAQLFRKGEDDRRPHMKDYLSSLRLNEIANAYDMSIDEAYKKPEMWKSTVRTPFIVYDVFNWISYIARHDERLSTDEVNQLRIKSGRMLLDEPNLLAIAEEKQISKKPWILSPN